MGPIKTKLAEVGFEFFAIEQTDPKRRDCKLSVVTSPLTDATCLERVCSNDHARQVALTGNNEKFECVGVNQGSRTGDQRDHWISKLDACSIGRLDGKIRDHVYVRIGTSRAGQLIVI